MDLNFRGETMLFHKFKNQEERRNYGGSAFIEIQFCNMPSDTTTEMLVSGDNIEFWKDDSLYVSIEEDSQFYQEYSHIFNCGIYSNLNTGIVDLYGINYYAPHLIDSIIDRIYQAEPKDYKALTEWLINAKKHNGFYILGI